MSERINQHITAVNAREIPANPLTDDEQVSKALSDNLGPAAAAVFRRIMDPMTGEYDEFLHAIQEFNALSSEERGHGKYDSGRPLTENKDRVRPYQTPRGFQYEVTLLKNGEITVVNKLS